MCLSAVLGEANVCGDSTSTPKEDALNGWRMLRALRIVTLIALVPLLAAPAARGVHQFRLNPAALAQMSQAVAARYYVQHPDQAPTSQRAAFRAAHDLLRGDRVAASEPTGPLKEVFNRDELGLPQNEESVSVCQSDPEAVLEGTNDYRGIVDPNFNFTGWHLSTDGGRSLANEGLLPTAGGLASSGDPAAVLAFGGCGAYMADLNFNTFSTAAGESGIGVYRSDVDTLSSCAGEAAKSCWPTRRLVAVNQEGHFLDKEWLDVGVSGDAGRVAWVTYTDFNCFDPSCDIPFTNSIKAVRCDAALSECTDPILISGRQNSLQFSDVTIAPDGRTIITWEEDTDLNTHFQPPEHMRFWMRVAPPGSLDFGPLRPVARERLPFAIATLHANDFRAATLPQNTVADMETGQRVFVTWAGCFKRALGNSICEEPAIKLTYSDDWGVSWSKPTILSIEGDNYFPSIDADPTTGNLMIAYYTNRFDPVFHNRQDVELLTIDPSTVEVVNRQRLTPVSNETEADPILGGSFIGDYIEVSAFGGEAHVGYNANYRSERLLFGGLPIPQQDNYLTVVGE